MDLGSTQPLTEIITLFILTANGFTPSGSGTTIRHKTQTTHITQNYTHIKHPTQNENTQSQLHLYKLVLINLIML
jgi:hypothetical protein